MKVLWKILAVMAVLMLVAQAAKAQDVRGYCGTMGSFAYMTAVQRDAGTPRAEMQRLASAKLTHESVRVTVRKVIDNVYNAPSQTPASAQIFTEAACLMEMTGKGVM